MPTSVISNSIKDGAGVVQAGVLVIIDMVPGPTFRISDGSEIEPVSLLKTDVNGTWTVPLEESTNLDPPGTYYRVREYLTKSNAGLKTYFFQVPAADGLLHDNLIVPSTADSILRPTVVTSVTRPTTPYVGQMIFETDTGKVLFYYGTTLGWLPDWGQSWGEIAVISSTTDFTTTSGTYVDATGLVNNAWFTAILGRRYLTEFSGWIEDAGGAAGGPCQWAIVNGSGTVLTERAAEIGTGAAFALPLSMSSRSAGTENGVVGRRIQVKSPVGRVAKVETDPLHPAVLSVYDVGPANPPVIT